MADSDIDAKFTAIQDTVHGIHVNFTEMKGELKATNKSVDTLCVSLDGYVKSTESRLLNMEQDLGNRIPDDPNVYSQLQKLNGFRKRTVSGLKMLWGLGTGILLLIFGQIANALGWFGKGH